jgi:hypothetical protein
MLALLVLALIGLAVGLLARYGRATRDVWRGRSGARTEGRHKLSRSDVT